MNRPPSDSGLVESGNELSGQVAAVVGVGAAFGHAADGVGEVGIDQDFALAGRSAIAQVDVCGGGVPGEEFGAAGERAGDTGWDWESLLGVTNRRGHQVGHGDGAEIAVHGLPSGGLTGHGDGVRAGYGHERQALVAVVIGLGAGAGDSAAVDVGDLAGGGFVGEDERVAAQSALGDDGDGFDGGDGKGGVERGSAVLETRADRRRQPVVNRSRPCHSGRGRRCELGW